MEEHKDPEEELGSQEEEYLFLQETIKNEHGDMRKGFLRMAGLGLVFGVFACFSFSALKPAMDEIFQSDPQKVTIPQEEEEEEQNTQEEEQETVPQVLDADSYRQMQQSLTSIAVEANKSVVEIVGIAEDQDWTEGSYDQKKGVSGLIIADNGRELLILGKSSIAKEAQELQVVFGDGNAYQATLKKSEGTLGLGIYAVNRTDIQDSTWTQIKIAILGSSNVITKGDVAIVLGKPFGYAGAMGFGSVASGKNVLGLADGQFRLINTDIAGAKSGSGFIVNLKGEVVAIIDQSVADEDSKELIAGYGISDVKDIIECLSNGEGVPYIGVHGVDVTEEIEAQGIPKGVYIKEIDPDSPAMAAGIQSGDVITSMNGTDITTYAGYHSMLMDAEVGDKITINGQRQGADGYVDIEFDVTIDSRE